MSFIVLNTVKFIMILCIYGLNFAENVQNLCSNVVYKAMIISQFCLSTQGLFFFFNGALGVRYCNIVDKDILI